MHHFLSKIPNSLWWDVFGGEFNDDSIPHLNKEYKDLVRGDLPKNSTQALIVLLIRYPEVQAHELLPFIRDTLKVPNGKIFEISATMGHLSIIKQIKANG